MLRPVIFIGCGGSGTKAVRYVRAAVQRSLDQAGWPGEMPDSWQFIGLDTLTFQEDPAEIPTIPVNDFLALSADYDTYPALHRALIAAHTGKSGELLCGWLPNPDQAKIPIKDGAGQSRAIGRAAGLRSLERTLKPRLKEAFRRAKSGNQDLIEVGRYLGVQAELGSETPQPLVAVCSSMAGGTGAGVSLDVVDLLRSCDPLGAYPILVLFANDIFDLHGQAIAGNSLGLMSELLAAYWSEPGEIESPLSTNNVQGPGVGPHSLFVLGKEGLSGADLGSTVEFYRAAGEALSSWVTSSTVQENITNFIYGNWLRKAKANYGGYPFGRQSQFGAVSSFGVASVTVGRDRFAEWARDLLSKQVFESLLHGHRRLNPKAASDSRQTDEELELELGKLYAEMVFCGHARWEPSPDRFSGCRGAGDHFGSDEQLRAKALSFSNKIKQLLTAGQQAKAAGQQAKAEQWLSVIERYGKECKSDIDRDNQTMSRQDSAWCQDMVAATCRAASQVAAVSSLRVAAAALTEAAQKLIRAEISDVRAKASTADTGANKKAKDGLENIQKIEGKFSADDSRLVEAVTLVAQGLAYNWQHRRLLQAVDVLENAETQVLGVIADALRAASGQVGAAMDSDEVESWPEYDTEPNRYRPSTVEFPLESHRTWADSLEELCSEAEDQRIGYGTRSTDPLRYRLVAGTDILETVIAPLVHPSRAPWTPGQSAQVVCDVETAEITQRVQRWIRDPGRKFRRFLDEGLGAYLRETDPVTDKRRVDHAERLRRFREQLGKAKNRSEPLISVDKNLYGQCHENSLELETACSGFPFSENHPAEQDSIKIVGEEAYKRSNADTSSVLISQYIENPVHPLVVRSITRPVSDALAKADDPDERAASFWMWCRARRLDGFVPLPRPLLESIIRGFAVARLCGYVTANVNQPMRITAGPTEVDFPWPLLSRQSHPNDVLAGLLEGFSLTFGMVSGRGFSAYEGYKRLYDLGEPTMQQMIHADLQEVLDTGKPPHPTVGHETPKAQGADREERRLTATDYLELNEGWFLEQQTKRAESEPYQCSSDGRASPGVPTMELAELFRECYSELRKLLETYGPGGTVV